MTVPSAINKSGPYTGNGVTTSFAYGFRILDASHIRVVRTENGIDTILTSGFTVTGVGAAGGSVVFSVAPTATQTITLIRNAPFTQQTDLENQGAYYAQTIEDALDLGVMRDQQLQEQVDRSVKIPVGAATFDLDALVNDIVRVADSVAAVDTVASNIADVGIVADNIADVGIVADNLADVTNFADVYQGPKAVAPVLRNNGSPLLSGDLYFDTVDNRMKVRASAAWVNAASSVNGMIAQYAYTATAGQTVFAAVYDIGFVTVYLNGVKLVSGDDFTALNGTSITLATGAAVGDSIEIIGFGAFATADMLQKSQNGADIPDKAAFRAALGINGIGSETAPTITNLNTLTVAGEYFAASGATGSPNSEPIIVKMLAADATTRAEQVVTGLTTGRKWWRIETASVWGAWNEYQRVNPATLTAEGTANAGFAGGFAGRNNGGGVGTGVFFDANIRGSTVGGMHVTDDSEFGSAVRLLANRTGVSDGDRRFTAYLVDRNAGQFTAHLGAPATLLPKFDCRAWVNFNGTNGAIRASGNVSSVVRNGVGDYTVNFAAAMPDANYGVMLTGNTDIPSGSDFGVIPVIHPTVAQTTSSVRILCAFTGNGSLFDISQVHVAIFR
jgi:hypothetical protein